MIESTEWAEVLTEIRSLKAECELLLRITSAVDEIERNLEPGSAPEESLYWA